MAEKGRPPKRVASRPNSRPASDGLKRQTTSAKTVRTAGKLTSHQARYLRHLEGTLIPFPTPKSVLAAAVSTSSVAPRSMWFVNLSILSCADEEQAELADFMENTEVLHQTQIVVNYDRLESDLKAKMIRVIQKIAPAYHGAFYIEPNRGKFEHAVEATRKWMEKSRSLSNPLHYSPPPIPTIMVRLCEPLPVDEDLMMEDAEHRDVHPQI